MVEIVEPSWLKDRLRDPTVRVVDPRPWVEYLQGHIPHAVNLPVSRIFDHKTLGLLPDKQLARVVGDAGIHEKTAVLLYDSQDGQRAAMLGWLLDYLGHPDVKILSVFLQGWREQAGEIAYRLVKVPATEFHAKANPSVRAVWQDLLYERGERLLDLRSEEEFRGESEGDPRRGHLPAAVNLPWTRLIGEDNQFLRHKEQLEAIVADVGLGRSDRIVTYCRTGPRASVGYVALRHLGYQNVRVYDGSFRQWAGRPELPVQTGS